MTISVRYKPYPPRSATPRRFKKFEQELQHQIEGPWPEVNGVFRRWDGKIRLVFNAEGDGLELVDVDCYPSRGLNAASQRLMENARRLLRARVCDAVAEAAARTRVIVRYRNRLCTRLKRKAATQAGGGPARYTGGCKPLRPDR